MGRMFHFFDCWGNSRCSTLHPWKLFFLTCHGVWQEGKEKTRMAQPEVPSPPWEFWRRRHRPAAAPESSASTGEPGWCKGSPVPCHMHPSTSHPRAPGDCRFEATACTSSPSSPSLASPATAARAAASSRRRWQGSEPRSCIYRPSPSADHSHGTLERRSTPCLSCSSCCSAPYWADHRWTCRCPLTDSSSSSIPFWSLHPRSSLGHAY